MTVVDPDAARAGLRTGALLCPQDGCEGRLRAWSKARARQVLMGGGRRVLVHPDRGRCRACGVTQVLLPAACLPRRAYGVEVVGAILNAAADGSGYRRAATTMGIPVGTARAWIRSVARNSAGLTARALRVVQALGADTGACWIGGPDPVHPVRAALQALGAAAHALAQHGSRTSGSSAGPITGIDYLGLLAASHHQNLHRWLRLGDPTFEAAAAAPWCQVTMITGGRLLTANPSG